MTTNVGVTVAEVIEAVRRRKALLAPETAGYLVLGVADQVAGEPGLIDEHRCGVLVEGGRIFLEPSAPAGQADAERSLRRLLRRLLDASNGSAPALSTVAGLPARGNVTILISELESALIPVNRGAASRALSRLAREALRARDVMMAPPTEPLLTTGSDGEGAANSLTDDTDPTAGSMLVEESLAAARESLESIDPDSIELPPPREPPSFAEEAVTARRPPIISEPPPTTSLSDIDQLLQQTIPSNPPPPVAPDVPPAPSIPDVLIPPPMSDAPLVPEVNAPEPVPGTPPLRYSSDAPSARGVDELLQDFMVSTSRKNDRVAQDLRHMTGVESSPVRRYESSVPASQSKPEESPFQTAAGTAEFYTSTPAPHEAGRSMMPSLPDEDPLARRSTRRKVYVLFAFLALMTIGTVTIFRLKPGVLTGRTPEVIEAERREAAALAASIAARKAAGPCRATLVVSDVPQGAEVLVRSGIAPVDVERLPSGARLEFVALTDGYAPRRGVVPQGAAWDTVNGKPRFELPIQLEKSHAKGGTLDPWPAADPGSVVGGQGPPGTVHLVTSPKGAEVWMVAGGSPEAKLEALPCGAGMELLVAGTAQGQHFRRRLRVDASQLTPEPAANAATGRVSAAK
jgi:hypothetical protein